MTWIIDVHMIIIVRLKSGLMLQKVVPLLYVTHREEKMKAEKERGHLWSFWLCCLNALIFILNGFSFKVWSVCVEIRNYLNVKFPRFHSSCHRVIFHTILLASLTVCTLLHTQTREQEAISFTMIFSKISVFTTRTTNSWKYWPFYG